MELNMMKKGICSLAILLLLTSCAATTQPAIEKYPKKTSSSSGDRKAGPAMSFFEQAEHDRELDNDVIIIPPEEVAKRKAASAVQE